MLASFHLLKSLSLNFENTHLICNKAFKKLQTFSDFYENAQRLLSR